MEAKVLFQDQVHNHKEVTMPGGKGYPTERVAKGEYEMGQVAQGNKPVSNDGTEEHSIQRAGKDEAGTDNAYTPHRAGSNG